jgi:hypothetical protein
LVVFLLGVLVVDLLLLRHYWRLDDRQVVAGTREFEVFRTSLQILGVVLLGAALGLTAGMLESSRTKRAKWEERAREQFDIRSALVDQTSRCAQAMHVACQHVRRQLPYAVQPRIDELRTVLEEAYLAFSPEALALGNQIGARYGVVRIKDSTSKRNESWWRWHQIYDLLTVYYFILAVVIDPTLEPKVLKVLDSNSKTSDALHGGHAFPPKYPRNLPKQAGFRSRLNSTKELRELAREAHQLLPDLAAALLTEEWLNPLEAARSAMKEDRGQRDEQEPTSGEAAETEPRDAAE